MMSSLLFRHSFPESLSLFPYLLLIASFSDKSQNVPPHDPFVNETSNMSVLSSQNILPTRVFHWKINPCSRLILFQVYCVSINSTWITGQCWSRIRYAFRAFSFLLLYHNKLTKLVCENDIFNNLIANHLMASCWAICGDQQNNAGGAEEKGVPGKKFSQILDCPPSRQWQFFQERNGSSAYLISSDLN